jgi:hypothetical protein
LKGKEIQAHAPNSLVMCGLAFHQINSNPSSL